MGKINSDWFVGFLVGVTIGLIGLLIVAIFTLQ